MAIVNDYVTGTISLTSGSANFTSTGAALQSAGIRAGDEILLPAKGMVLVIASITGENAGTLTDNCPAGAAGAGQPMRIRFQPDGSRYTAAARALVELLANGKLASLAGVAAAADQLPYFTGGTTFGLTSLTAFARSLLDDTNAAGVYGTLGIVPDGQLPDRLRALGSTTLYADWNSVPLSDGFYRMSNTATNAPFAGFALCFVHVFSATAGAQIAMSLQGGTGAPAMWYRNYNSAAGNWTSWRPLVPDYGSNANGSYVRFADGTQVCFVAGLSGLGATIAVGSIFTSSDVSWSFPAVFASTPAVSASVNNGGNWVNARFVSINTALFRRFSATSNATAETVSAMATGRWL